MVDDNLNADSPERTYFVSLAAAEDKRRSLPLIVYNRQCWTCRREMEIERAVSSSAQRFVDVIVEHCSQQPDYLPPDTPVKEAIFRVLLAGGNKRMTAEGISDELSRKWAMTHFPKPTSPRVIRRLLESARDYYCIVSSDSGYEYREKLGESVKPTAMEKPATGGGKTSTIVPEPPKPPRSRPTIVKPPIAEPSREPKTNDPGDPFARPSDAWSAPPSASPEANADFARLLYWISARGEGTWAQFRDAAQTLGVVQDRDGARSAMRRLILLGHVDQSDDGARWSASPPALVRFADGAGGGYVAGARTPSFLSELERYGALTESPQEYYAGPPRIEPADAVSRDAAIAERLGIADAGIASERLADVLPNVDGWKDSLKAVEGIVPASYDVVERWEGGEFRPCDTLSLRDGRYRGESGMYRFIRANDATGRTPTLFFDEPSQRFLRGDWYGLRFLSLAAGGGLDAVQHSARDGALLIPESHRLPLIYERALTLASGLLPTRAENPNWLSYPLTPLSLAETLCGKLNVNMSEKADA